MSIDVNRQVGILRNSLAHINEACQQIADIDAQPGQPDILVPGFYAYVSRVSEAASAGQAARDALLTEMTAAEARDAIRATLRPGPTDLTADWAALVSAVTAWRAAYGSIHNAIPAPYTWTNNVLTPVTASIPAGVITANATLLTASVPFV